MTMPRQPQNDPDKDMDPKIELLVSRLLRGGVALSMVVLLLGIGIMFVHDQPGNLSRHGALPALIGREAAFPHTVTEVIEKFDGFAGQAVIAAGLLVLIATPVLRVAVSILAFARQRDWTYVALTTFVLMVLLISFLIGKAG